MHLSVIIPLYRCQPFIDELCQRLAYTLAKIHTKYEIIFVNDQSPANDWAEVVKAAYANPRIKGINLSRNFGQHYAITAGLSHAKGKWVVVMDGDLQDQPEEIEKLYHKAQTDYDIVLARRVERRDGLLKRRASKQFYRTLAYLTDTEQNAEVANFGIYHRKVIGAILSMHDKTRYFPTMVKWVGFKRTEIEVAHAARTQGKSSYNLKGLMRLALNTILAFSDKPLRLTMKLGITMSAFSLFFALWVLYRAITGQIAVMGYSSLIISIWFLSSVIITLIGMMGLYVGRIFDQVKDRPVFIVAEMVNFEER